MLGAGPPLTLIRSIPRIDVQPRLRGGSGKYEQAPLRLIRPFDSRRKAATRQQVFCTRRREYVVDDGSFRSRRKTVFDTARDTPEIAGGNLELRAILPTNSGASKTQAPLLLWVRMPATGGIRVDANHRDHRIPTREYPGRHAVGQLSADALLECVDVEKIVSH